MYMAKDVVPYVDRKLFFHSFEFMKLKGCNVMNYCVTLVVPKRRINEDEFK